ncbi:TPA: type VI secretion system protein TssA [Klebsiella oxytoca]|uniref:Type VI secretion system protein TssA n=1 Tax=Klebsiella oxytoca TaxID=571 RepID=A0AAN5L9U8_KLEOX|nr:type VI secretion system protein TssA [Klebsiella oxytoca]
MDNRHPWCSQLLAVLPGTAVAAPIAADDPLWEKVETGMMKLGSPAHEQLDLNEMVTYCLTLLESRTKDMRVLSQLLRCLQHPAKVASFSTAIILLDCWIGAYWMSAWPVNTGQKQRLMRQIIRRFEAVTLRMSEQASAEDLAKVLVLAESLAVTWQRVEPEKGHLLKELLLPLRRVQRQQQEQTTTVCVKSETPQDVPQDSTTTATVTVPTNVRDERAWRQTLLNVSNLLVEQQPNLAVGYRLRRHAIWHAITAPPVAGKDNKTQLAPVSADRVSEYETLMMKPDPGLWCQVEESLTLSPYWFEGHRLSAGVATSLGCTEVALAIADELDSFLRRLPVLKTLTFSDGSPFFPVACDEWLREVTGQTGADAVPCDLADEVKRHFQEKGLNAALLLLEETARQQPEPRERFYASLMLADLLAAGGMKSLATSHYHQLWQESRRLGLVQWEPGLVKRLERSARIRG